MLFRSAAAAAQSTGRILDSLKEVLPQANECEVLGTWANHDSTGNYYAIRSSGSLLGYAIESWGKGYQSTISVLVAVDLDLTVKAVHILGQQETEGLGTRIMEPEFLSQFSGKRLEQLAVTTEGAADRINAITAATISSRAVTEDAVAGAVAFLKQKLSR